MRNTGLATIALFSALLVSACQGPEPSIIASRLHPPHDVSQPYRVEVVVRNASPGKGQITVQARLISKASGESYQGETKADLEENETTHVSLLIYAPPAEYEISAMAKYPPG